MPRHLVLPDGKQLARHSQRAGLIAIRVRSTALGSEGVLALSRARKEGKHVVMGSYALSRGDRALSFMEKVLVRLGFFVGEEIRMVFKTIADEEAIQKN